MRIRTAVLAGLVLLIYSCAQQTTPTGGPKDEDPPYLVRSTPDSAQRNFKGRTIELTFNELLQLQNPKEEIIITPSLGKKTQFKLKDNRVIVEPELPFRENTTYTLNFREGIKDATEGNVSITQLLAFSTGPDLDTLKIEGSIKSALTEKIPENITVAIYAADTFDIFQHSPEYFTKTSKDGTFKLTNLKEGGYHIYAFEDRNKNLKIESQSEQFGFLSKPISLQKNISKLSIALTRVDSRPLKLASVRNQSNVNTIRLNKPVVSYRIAGPNSIFSTFGSSQAEVIAYYPERPESALIDSILVHFTATDSIDQEIDTAIYIHKSDREKIKETFRTNVTEPIFNADTQELEFRITFNKPIKALLHDSVYIQSDTATIIPLGLRRAVLDTIRNELVFSQKLQLRDSLIVPVLRFGLGALISIDDDSTAVVTRNFDVLNQQNTASLLVHVQTKQTNYIVQVLNSENKVIASAVNTPKPVFRYLKPETLKLRVIIDENGNGKWDTINYLTNRQPEPCVFYINSDKKYDIPLRANWEVGPNVIRF